MRADDYGIRRQIRLNVKGRVCHTNTAGVLNQGYLHPVGHGREPRG